MATKRKGTNPAVSEYLASIGRKGGLAQVPKGVATMSPEKRAEIAMKGVAARRAKAAKKKLGAKNERAS